jgi:2-polyprenyl-6-methoxyphenol hydroxylase-like FAD-dependent oxidoreductase
MACVSTALIVGGGIAGLASAIALSRVGVQCDVVETGDGPLGASLGLSGRAADALGELGVYDECYETGRPFEIGATADSLFDSTGRLLRAGPKRPEWPGAKTALGVYRPVFLQILEDTAKRLGATLTRGLTVQAIDDDNEGSFVTMTNGERRRYDFVLGADGIGSRTRAMLFPEHPKPIYSGQISYRWMIPAPPIEGEGFYVGPLGRVGFYYLPHQKLVYVPGVIDAPELKRKTKEEIFQIYTNLLASFTAPAILELRKHLTPDSDLIYRPFEWTFLNHPWHKGRTLLIGDAAHATTAHMGMGGGMAIEDACVLAQCIASSPTLAEAFDAFMKRRFDRVRTVVETSVALSRLEQEKAPPAKNADLLTSAFQKIGEPY